MEKIETSRPERQPAERAVPIEGWPRMRPFNEAFAGGWVGGMAFSTLNTPIACPSEWSR